MEIETKKDDVLLSKPYFTALARRLAYMEESRREVPNSLTDVIFYHIEKGGVIEDGDGNVIPIPDDIIEKAFGEEGSFKIISDWINKAEIPRKRRSKRSLLLRFQLFDAYFKILNEEIDPKDGEDLYRV